MKKYSLINLAAFLLMVAMFLLMVGSTLDDVFTVDEVAHIGAGYSYLIKHDYRLNPEHPPLIKDLAAVPLLFLRLNGSFESQAWQNGMLHRSSWDMGRELLSGPGNDPQKIMFWARLPMILLTLLLGFFIFRWARELFGDVTALVVLVFYAFSPTFLAHGRFVTTDLGATIGIFASMYYFWHFLKQPSGRNIFWAGVFFGLAQLTKFSAVLLIPFYAVMSAVWIIIRLSQKSQLDSKFGFARKTIIGLIFIGAIGYALVVWPFYLFHVQGMSAGYQLAEACDVFTQEQLLGPCELFGGKLTNKATEIPPLLSDRLAGLDKLAQLDLWLISKPYLRAPGQYLLGLLMAVQRENQGSPTYFLGEVSASAWWYYFPVVYFLKETLALHLLTLLAVVFSCWQLGKWFRKNIERRFKTAAGALYNHFPTFLMLTFIIFYWVFAMRSKINIGVRHLLPTFPFIIMLVIDRIMNLIKAGRPEDKKRAFNSVAWERYKKAVFFKAAALGVLACWMVLSVFRTQPYFLSYFNESIGGPANGYRYVVDSNLDWGQDLKRLADFVEKNNIGKIKLSYFGWSDPGYYLENRAEPLQSEDEDQKGWIAVSAHYLQTNCLDGRSNCSYDQRAFHWLDKYAPLAKIGNSIFVYHLE